MRTLSPAPLLGLGTVLQELPSQCWTNVRRVGKLPDAPTAHTLFGETALLPNTCVLPPTLQLGVTVHPSEHAPDNAGDRLRWVVLAAGRALERSISGATTLRP